MLVPPSSRLSEPVAAELKKRLLTKDFAVKRLQLQATHIHEFVVVVDADVATVAVENPGVIGQQILLLRPNAGERLSPKLHANLPIRGDRVCRQSPLDRVQSSVGVSCSSPNGALYWPALICAAAKLMPVNPDVRGRKRQSVVTESVAVGQNRLPF